jgi:Uma2 family endonuclease
MNGAASAVLIKDRDTAEQIQADRKERGIDKWDEVWDGVYVVPSLPNDEHQELQALLLLPLLEVVQLPGLGKVRAGVNVTDRHPDWEENYRGPDVVVYLNTTTAVNYETHWLGGPDFLVEIISPSEDPMAKFDFYAKVKSREVMIVDRNPWAVELYRLKGKKLVLVGRSDEAKSAVLASTVLPLTFKLIAVKPRPRVEVTHPKTKKTWLV